MKVGITGAEERFGSVCVGVEWFDGREAFDEEEVDFGAPG